MDTAKHTVRLYTVNTLRVTWHLQERTTKKKKSTSTSNSSLLPPQVKPLSLYTHSSFPSFSPFVIFSPLPNHTNSTCFHPSVPTWYRLNAFAFTKEPRFFTCSYKLSFHITAAAIYMQRHKHVSRQRTSSPFNRLSDRLVCMNN